MHPKNPIPPEQPQASSKSSFLKLVDYISGEQDKKLMKEDPQFKVKLIQIGRYKDTQSKKYEQETEQKGVQINKAA